MGAIPQTSSLFSELATLPSILSRREINCHIHWMDGKAEAQKGQVCWNEDNAISWLLDFSLFHSLLGPSMNANVMQVSWILSVKFLEFLGEMWHLYSNNYSWTFWFLSISSWRVWDWNTDSGKRLSKHTESFVCLCALLLARNKYGFSRPQNFQMN